MPLSLRNRWFLSLLCVLVLTAAGCNRSSSTPSSKRTTPAKPTGRTSEEIGSWEGFPNVPKVPLMEEIDGIKIPRLDSKTATRQIKGSVPVDFGNEFAKQNPGEPVTGDWLTIRFNAEPKTLNPIIETSAVQTYMGQYVQEPLVWQNPETFEYEPHIATKWVVEDSVKLAANLAGHGRRVALAEGKAQEELELEYTLPTGRTAEPPVVKLTTSDASGRALGGVWVGIYPIGKVLGAPKTGYHLWSDEKGSLDVSGLATGKYRVRVGDELFGKAERGEDGSLTVTPLSPKNPLEQLIQSSGDSALTLKKDEWVDVQEQTYYTYFLNDKATWSDGTPYSTRDLVFAYAIINNSDVDGDSIRTYYADIVSCDALDERTIRMRYRGQYFKAFEFTAGLGAYTPPWHVFEDYFKKEKEPLTLTMERLTEEQERQQKKVSVHGLRFARFFNTDGRDNDRPLGSGPYVFNRWVRGDSVELRRNTNYWNPDRAGHLDRIIVKFIPDDVTALQALRSGDIDFFYVMPSDQYYQDLEPVPGWFKERYVKAEWYSPSFRWMGWNLRRPVFQDQRVRVALSLLFDKQEFLEKRMNNGGEVVSGSQYYFSPGYDHTVKPLAYAPDVAAELLADAGWIDTNNDGVLDKNGTRFEFELLLPMGKKLYDDMAALYQRSLKTAGITMKIRTLEWASFVDKLQAKDFDAVTLAWAQPIESDPYQIWHGSGAAPESRGSNSVSFNHPLANELIEQLRVTLDEEERMKLHHSLHRLLDSEQPYMFLHLPKEYGAYHKRFQGVKWYGIRPGFDLTEWYVPKDQQLH